MDPQKIKTALADITAEQDPTLKSAKLAPLCSALWAERGVQLVAVGGSAIEILTEGAYASGDLDVCHANKTSLSVAERREVMALLNAKGGPAIGRLPECILICSARRKVLRIHRFVKFKRLAETF